MFGKMASIATHELFTRLLNPTYLLSMQNGDGHLTEDEFLSGCLQDEELSKMLAPNVAQ